MINYIYNIIQEKQLNKELSELSGNKRFGILVIVCFQIFLRFFFLVLYRIRINVIFYVFLCFVCVCVFYEILLFLFMFYIFVVNFEVVLIMVFVLNCFLEEGCKIMMWVYVNVF